MPVVTIRDAGNADLDSLEALETRVFSGDRLTRRSFRRFMGAPSARLRVAAEKAAGRRGAIVGYHLVLFRRGSLVARLYSIAVDGAMRGEGLGGRLLADAEKAATDARRSALRLEVRDGNRAAIRLYEGRGYRPIGRYAAYYADRADALRYEKQLTTGRGAPSGKSRRRP